MSYMILTGPLKDGEIDPAYCYCRPALRYDEEIEGETCSRYALPEGRDESEFTVVELDEAEALEVGERIRLRCERTHDQPYGMRVEPA